MTSVLVCPVCNGPIQAGDNICERCGFRLAGATESFSPVNPSTSVDVSGETSTEAKVQYSLYVAKGPQIGVEFYLDGDKLSIGRDPRCDIFLNDMTVSREHAVITIDNDKVTVQDDNSLNGTWVDGVIVSNAELKPGAILQIGTFIMVLQRHRDV